MALYLFRAELIPAEIFPHKPPGAIERGVHAPR